MHANAYYIPKLAKRLLKDIRWLPLWSCILRDRYGYGRVPASSAPSESDFNYVKTHLLKKRRQIRADEFIDLHVRLADAKSVNEVFTCSEESAMTLLENQTTTRRKSSEEIEMQEAISEENVDNHINLCNNYTKVDEDRILASREEENWRGQTSKNNKLTEKKCAKGHKNETKRSSRYLSKHQLVIDAVKSVRAKEIPLLKNGGYGQIKV